MLRLGLTWANVLTNDNSGHVWPEDYGWSLFRQDLNQSNFATTRWDAPPGVLVTDAPLRYVDFSL